MESIVHVEDVSSTAPWSENQPYTFEIKVHVKDNLSKYEIAMLEKAIKKVAEELFRLVVRV